MTSLSKIVALGEKKVKRIGLGTNRVTDTPEARSVLKRAAELGPLFIDTADTYQNGQSESMIGQTLSSYSENVVVGTKGGMVRGADPDNSEKHLRRVLEESLSRLKLDAIYLYQLHRVDARISVEQTMELFKQFQKEGKIVHIGLSEVSVEQIERARSVARIASVQNQYNLEHREYDPVVDYCEANGIAFLPWFPLSRGSGGSSGALAQVAARYGASPQQLALAWLLKRSSAMLPIPGTLSAAHFEENLAALDLSLAQEDYDLLSNGSGRRRFLISVCGVMCMLIFGPAAVRTFAVKHHKGFPATFARFFRSVDIESIF